MGIFDTILAELTCPRCGWTGQIGIQTKIHPAMQTYQVGDQVDWDRIVNITFEDEAYCPKCEQKIRTARERIDQELRRNYNVPNEVKHEWWLAWPDGSPVLPETKEYLAYEKGDLPNYGQWCVQKGYDSKVRGQPAGDQRMEYLSTVVRPYRVKIKAPDGWLTYTHPDFQDVNWRNLLDEALQALATQGEIPDDYAFAVIVEVKNRVIRSVTVKVNQEVIE